MQKITRRQAMYQCFAVSAAMTGMGIKGALANEFGKYVTKADVQSPPRFKTSLFRAQEYNAGSPLQYIPQAKIIKTVANRTQASKITNSIPKLDRLLKDLSSQPPLAQMAGVNGFANSFPYKTDKKHYGTQERWVMPQRFYKAGGDCEDYAIAKFTALRALGFHSDRMRIVLLEDGQKSQYHAVLAVYYDGSIHILDNQMQKVTDASSIGHYNPLCSLNDRNLWVHWRKQRDHKQLDRKFTKFVTEQKSKMLRPTSLGQEVGKLN